MHYPDDVVVELQQQKPWFVSASIEIAAGTAGGIAATLLGHPLDTLKVRLQTRDASTATFGGPWELLKQTVREEGARGLYKGITSPLGFCAALTAVLFTSNGVLSRLLVNGNEPPSREKQLLAGAGAGLVSVSILCPMELIKSRLQVQYKGQQQYSGSLDCIRQVVRFEGLRGLYRGAFSTACMEVPAGATYFAVYEALKDGLSTLDGWSTSGQLHTAGILLSGGLAGVASWVVSFPQDSIKARIQTDKKGIYKTFFQSAKEIWRRDGYMGFWRGFGLTVLRTFPANAVTFYAFEVVCSKLNDLLDGK